MTKLFCLVHILHSVRQVLKITTLEGLQEEAELLAACIASEGADQCGFCTTGMMMSAINLKRKNPKASDDEIREYLIGNLCRCNWL